MIGILIDVTKCIGCNQCVDSCTQVNKLGLAIPASQDTPDGLSAQRWISILKQPGGHNIRKQCRHCLEPACVSVCPVGAMHKTGDGPVIYDSKKCMGCRYCIMACPYGIPRYQWSEAAPLVSKCILCYGRIQEGQLPACVEACPEQAAIFGDRDELLAEAHQRLQAEPDKYVQKVYGEREVGGTSVLYISDIPLEFLGFQGDPGEQPLPELSWGWLSKVTPLALTTTGLMSGLFFVIGRRMQVEDARAASDQSSQAEEQE